jgi:hypothetical protein
MDHIIRAHRVIGGACAGVSVSLVVGSEKDVVPNSGRAIVVESACRLDL